MHARHERTHARMQACMAGPHTVCGHTHMVLLRVCVADCSFHRLPLVPPCAPNSHPSSAPTHPCVCVLFVCPRHFGTSVRVRGACKEEGGGTWVMPMHSRVLCLSLLLLVVGGGGSPSRSCWQAGSAAVCLGGGARSAKLPRRRLCACPGRWECEHGAWRAVLSCSCKPPRRGPRSREEAGVQCSGRGFVVCALLFLGCVLPARILYCKKKQFGTGQPTRNTGLPSPARNTHKRADPPSRACVHTAARAAARHHTRHTHTSHSLTGPAPSTQRSLLSLSLSSFGGLSSVIPEGPPVAPPASHTWEGADGRERSWRGGGQR